MAGTVSLFGSELVKEFSRNVVEYGPESNHQVESSIRNFEEIT